MVGREVVSPLTALFQIFKINNQQKYPISVSDGATEIDLWKNVGADTHTKTPYYPKVPLEASAWFIYMYVYIFYVFKYIFAYAF